MEKWTKQPALGLSAGSWKLNPLRSSKSTNLKSSSHFMCYKQCLVKLKMNIHTYIYSMLIYTVYMSWSKVQHLFHGLYRGIPHWIPLCWHVGESTPFSEWFMNGYRPRCGSVDAGSLKGGRRLCIKGRSWNMQHQGRLTIFTSIAQCGRHFKDTSSLKIGARTFMCGRIYLLHCPHFMWSFTLSFLARRWPSFLWEKLKHAVYFLGALMALFKKDIHISVW